MSKQSETVGTVDSRLADSPELYKLIWDAACAEQLTIKQTGEILDEVDDLDESDRARLFFLLDEGDDLQSALKNYADLMCGATTPKEWAEELYEQKEELPEI